MKETLILAINNLQVERSGEATLDDINQEWIDREIQQYKCTVNETNSKNEKEIVMQKDKIIGKFIIDGNLNIIEIEDSDINLTYEIISRDVENAKILIKIVDTKSGIDQIECPDGNIIYCKGKKEVAIDYTVKIGEEYKFKITSKTGKEKEGIIKIEDETWDAWIKLTLYYPPNSINKMWRLGEKGEVRSNLSLEWKEYTGPITIPMSRTKDVWIKYDLNNKHVIKPPEDTVLVEIENEQIEDNKQKITIIYDEEAIVKEYNIDGTEWKNYTGEFTIEKSCLIMARAKKQEKVKDNNGNIIVTQDKWGEDNKYITIITSKDIQDLINNGTITEQEKEDAEDKVKIDKIEKEHPEIKDEIDKIRDDNPEKTDKEIIDEIIDKHPEIEVPDVTPEEIIKELIKEEEIKPEDVEKIPENVKDIVEKNNVLQGPQIIITPETEKVEEVKVKITTKEEAREIYIKIGEDKYIKYEQEITINKNTLISAYYINKEGKQSKTSYKQITNIKKGNLPYLKIKADPYPYPNDTGRKSVKITLEYEDANNIEYSEDGVRYKSYLGNFTITKNERIYARATNKNGTTKAYLDITNIGDITQAPEKSENINNTANNTENTEGENTTQGNTAGGNTGENEGENQKPEIEENEKYTIINKNEYYLIKLKYPSNATLKEYKIKNQEWKHYNEEGILLIKPEFKDDVLDEQGKLKGKIQNEKGQLIDFHGDIQVLNIDYDKIYENILIRWNAYPGPAPTIIPSTTEPSKNVEIGILYDELLVKRQYKIKYSDNTETEWKDYKETILIEQNDITIYARGLDTSEVWTNEAIYHIENIDNEPPVIKIKGDFNKTIRNLQITINVVDKNKIDTIKFSEGKQSKEYFIQNGEAIKNNSRKTIKENGIYTIYAKDIIGNDTIYELNITNIDTSAVPNPVITLDQEPYLIDGVEWYPYGTKMTIIYVEDMTDLEGQYRYKNGEKEDNNSWNNWNGWYGNGEYGNYTVNLYETQTWQSKIKDTTGEESEIIEEEIHIMAHEDKIQNNYLKKSCIGNIYPVLITSKNTNGGLYGKDIYLIENSYIKNAAKHVGLTTGKESKTEPKLLRIKIVECPEEGYIGCKRNGVTSNAYPYNENYLGFVFVNDKGEEIKCPIIESISQVPLENEITIAVEAKAYNGTQIDKYYYKIDNEEYKESGSSTYKFTEVAPFVNHTIEVYVKDTNECVSGAQKITSKIIVPMQQIKTGENESLAIDIYGNLYAWGMTKPMFDNYGYIYSNYPTQIYNQTKFKKVEVGKNGNYLAIDENNKLLSWGRNIYGELGNGKNENEVEELNQIETGEIKFKEIATTVGTARAIDTDGNIWSWGQFYVGHADNKNKNIPIKLKNEVKFKEVKVGGYSETNMQFSTLCLDENGNIWTWGNNDFGQLGDETTEKSNIPKQIKVDGTRFKEISEGSVFSLAIDENGNIWSWGYNSEGELGNGTTEKSNIPKQIKVDGIKFKKISAGENYSLAIDESGNIWSWGCNNYGQLGNGTTEKSNIPKQININGTKFKEISAGKYHSLAIDEDGNIWSWGDNKHGQLGNETNKDLKIPTIIK